MVGTNIDKIVSTVASLLEDENYYTNMSGAINPYGDGTAAGKIVDVLARKYGPELQEIDYKSFEDSLFI